jgi:hypothetical protein
MINSGDPGLATLLIGDIDTSLHAFREELTLCRQTVVRPVAFEGLRGLAAIATVKGDVRRAATLVGAAEAHRYDNAKDPVHARLESAFFAPARARHGTDAWNDSAREGTKLTFDAAIAYALHEPLGSRRPQSESFSQRRPLAAAVTGLGWSQASFGTGLGRSQASLGHRAGPPRSPREATCRAQPRARGRGHMRASWPERGATNARGAHESAALI